jgi:parvulin-like peptidyl-prolyl isomerase
MSARLPGNRRGVVPVPVAALILASVVAHGACRTPADREPESDLIMALQDTQVTLTDFHHWVERNVTLTGYAELSPQARSRLLDQMIEEEILLYAAAEGGIHVGETEVDAYLDQLEAPRPSVSEEFREDVRARLTIKRFREEILLADLTCDEKEVQEWYERHPERYEQAARYLIRHIFLDQESLIRKAEERLGAGEPFETVSAGENRNPLGAQARWVREEDMPPILGEAVAQIEPGSHTPILQSPEGFHILMLLDKKEGGLPPIGQVRDRLETDLLRAKSEKRIEETIEEMTGREPFLFMPENLDFPYVL